MTVSIFSARACPFAHRTRLVVLEKGIPFSLTEIDLENKPTWFRDVSLYGKVPAIEHEGRRIWESAIINEYLDEVFPRLPLLPADPGLRSQARIWIDYANTHFVPAFSKLLRAQSPTEEDAGRRALDDSLAFIEREVLAKSAGDGPYWLGSSVSLVDLSFYPWFERWPALEHFRAYSVAPELARLVRWRDAMKTRASVKQIENSVDFYIQRYARIAAPIRRALAI